MTASPLGFAPDHVLTFEIKLPWNTSPVAVHDFYAALQSRIESLPGVTAVGQIDALPTVDWHLRSNASTRIGCPVFRTTPRSMQKIVTSPATTWEQWARLLWPDGPSPRVIPT